MLICPVCGRKLNRENNAYVCADRHSFDISKSGYVNLLPPSGRGRHGDDKTMVRARTEFLNAGYYERLAEAVADALEDCAGGLMVDAGCGEGYYTGYICGRYPDAEVIGLDISKDALNAAAKRCRGKEFAVSSTAEMPLEDGCADAVINVFSPLFEKEFSRVLKSGGKLVRAVPLEKHLHELRALLYERPYDNEEPVYAVNGFTVKNISEIRYSIVLDNSMLKNLFMMTPYYYKTGKADQEKLDSIEKADITIEFGLAEYIKE